MTVERLDHVFVEYVPDRLEEAKLYISIDFGTVVHLCACGCGSEVVTPLGPTEWAITYDGASVSLAPSVGSWSLPCRSHYVIRRGHVRWASQWTKQEVLDGHLRDQRARAEQYHGSPIDHDADALAVGPRGRGLLAKVQAKLRAFFGVH